MPAFWNAITIPADTTFSVNYNAAGANNRTLTAGTYTWMAILNDLLTQLQLSSANFRVGISEFGHVTIDTNGAANYTVDWTTTTNGTYFRDLVGFTANLASAAIHVAPRRVRAALYLEQVSGASTRNATIRDHDPKGALTFAAQTMSLGGVTRTTTSNLQTDRASFEIQWLDNSARLTSPSGAVATTYANAASTESGLTLYTHAKDLWWDSTATNLQGWSDGRYVEYFATTPSWAVSGVAKARTAGSWTTWVFDLEACKEWQSVKARPPKTTAYHVTIPAREYVAP